MVYKLLLLVIVTAVNGFFAAAEVALISTRRSRLESLAKDGNLGAQAALKLLANPERLLSVVQVGIGICALAMGQFEEMITHQIETVLKPLVPIAMDHFVHGFSVFISFLLLTLTLVVAGEVVPKNIGFERAEKHSIIAATIIVAFAVSTAPIMLHGLADQITARRTDRPPRGTPPRRRPIRPCRWGVTVPSGSAPWP